MPSGTGPGGSIALEAVGRKDGAGATVEGAGVFTRVAMTIAIVPTTPSISPTLASARQRRGGAEREERVWRRAGRVCDRMVPRRYYIRIACEVVWRIFGDDVGYLLRPWVIRTYRVLFLNVGFELEHEEVFRGGKNGMELEVLISLMRRPSLGSG